MKVTVVTFYAYRDCEHYGAVILGELTSEQKQAIADRLGATRGPDENHEEGGDQIYFTVHETLTPDQVSGETLIDLLWSDDFQ